MSLKDCDAFLGSAFLGEVAEPGGICGGFGVRVAWRGPVCGGFPDFEAVVVRGTADPMEGCRRRGVGLASLDAPRDARFLLVSWDIVCLLATVVG